MRRAGRVLGVIALLGVAGHARGGFVEYTSKSEWVAAVGAFATIHFNEVPKFTFLTDEYAGLGVLFTDGDDQIDFGQSFIEDDWGLDGNGDINLSLEAPRLWLAVDHPSILGLRLYRDGALIYDGPLHLRGLGSFTGVVGTEPFDAVRIFGPKGSEVEIDDLHLQPGPCLGDLDASGRVDPPDLAGLLAAWGTGAGGGDLDGDGQVGITDLLTMLAHWGPCAFFVDCNGNGAWDYVDLTTGTSPDCNLNGIPDECDLAEGDSTDFDGNAVPDECQIPVNDDCQKPAPIADGDTAFLTVAATTDGSFMICNEGVFVFENDVWFLYTAPCTGTATFSVCSAANFDTRLAVFFAGSCPAPANPLACSDDAPGCGQTSEAELQVFQGFGYLVRVGGATGGGYGVLSASCEAP